MKIIGSILFIAGFIGIVVFGMQALNDSDSFNLFGLDIAFSSANWTPLIASGFVGLIGIVLYQFKR
ncbi:hypothetical protein [Mangrovibacterium lignilyticum]|uniref:hypothetical protein n=1 Tax=Mangrovibacterium lignilyticum TaxID=2668052 RepID=UPI0013D3126E|nr:hypothetical protein [Mangrovibacterium lignilyticum]